MAKRNYTAKYINERIDKSIAEGYRPSTMFTYMQESYAPIIIAKSKDRYHVRNYQQYYDFMMSLKIDPQFIKSEKEYNKELHNFYELNKSSIRFTDLRQKDHEFALNRLEDAVDFLDLSEEERNKLLKNANKMSKEKLKDIFKQAEEESDRINRMHYIKGLFYEKLKDLLSSDEGE